MSAVRGHQTIHGLFEERVQRTPHGLALSYNEHRLTYAEVNSQANQLCRYLMNLGVTLETLVGIYLEPSPEAVVAILAILKGGAAYLPLDLRTPPDRLTRILEHAKPALIITQTVSSGTLRDKNFQIVCMDAICESIAAQANSDLPSDATADNVAYVTYTSGSSGKPKAVVSIHRSVTNGLAWVPISTEQEDEVCSLNTSLSAGFSTSRLFLPLLTGVPLVIVQEEEARDSNQLVHVWESKRVTNGCLVTPMFNEMVKIGALVRLQHMRTLVIGGTGSSPDVFDSFFKSMPRTTLFDGYGASEIGGAAIVRTITGDATGWESKSTIFPNTEVYILDDEMNVVPEGVVGEIFVGAEHLARGYLGCPGLTAERLLPNPFGIAPGSRLYRTGDLGRSVSNRIEVIGRADRQVKIRAFRVDLGEIEEALCCNENIREAVVTAQEGKFGARLIAFVAANPGVTVSEIREHVRGRVPFYMEPSRVVLLPHLPHTETGTVDIGSLPLPEDLRPDLDVSYEPPRNAVEAFLATTWAETLELDRVGIHDNFLELGGHSLVATRICALIQDRFEIEIPLQAFFEQPSVSELAVQVAMALEVKASQEQDG